MTTYVTIPDTDVDTDSPVTVPLMTALRDNQISIAEGGPDAVVNQAFWHPYDMEFVDDGNDGVIYDHGVDGALSTVTSPDFEDGYSYLFVFNGLSGGTGNFTINPYKETGAGYIGTGTLDNFAAPANIYHGEVCMLLPRLSARAHSILGWMELNGTDATSTAGMVDLRARLTTADKILRVQFAIATGSLDAGTITMLRRRELLTG